MLEWILAFKQGSRRLLLRKKELKRYQKDLNTKGIEFNSASKEILNEEGTDSIPLV